MSRPLVLSPLSKWIRLDRCVGERLALAKAQSPGRCELDLRKRKDGKLRGMEENIGDLVGGGSCAFPMCFSLQGFSLEGVKFKISLGLLVQKADFLASPQIFRFSFLVVVVVVVGPQSLSFQTRPSEI